MVRGKCSVVRTSISKIEKNKNPFFKRIKLTNAKKHCFLGVKISCHILFVHEFTALRFRRAHLVYSKQAKLFKIAMQ